MLVTTGKRFVAFFDLLGFSAWIKAEGSAEVFEYVRGFLNLMIRASLPSSIVHADMSVTVDETDIGFINFSDSIVFYTRDDSDACCDLILRVSGGFMNGVITGPSRMIRGGIAHGEFYADPQSNAYVGQALIDAYHLEEAQDWLSCSLHSSIVRLPVFERMRKQHPNFVVKALVPLRNSECIPYCLNWGEVVLFRASLFNTEKGLSDCEERASRSLFNNQKEMVKLALRMRHTRDFLLHYNPYMRA